MIKKLAVAGASVALLATAAIPVFANGDQSRGGVSVDVTNTALTGNNSISGHEVKGGTVRSGSAEAYVTAKNIVKGDCGCTLPVSIEVDNSAKTGRNTISGHEVKGGRVTSGWARADVLAVNVVDTHVRHHRD